MKKNKPLLIIGLIFLIGSIGLLIYPQFSQFINNQFAKGTITQYENQVNTLSEEKKNELLSEAESYNKNLANIVSENFKPDAFEISDDYSSILNVTDDGLIGSVFIPKIDCNLPIYHGTTKDKLDKGAAHMANTSFPIGGTDTHAVISAHTAYPGKEFFNRLTELEKGDVFEITVLENTLYYKVIDIYTVLPHDSEKLKIERNKDLCTLVTCTPYSINTHRLLVRGERFFPVKMSTVEKRSAKTKPYYSIWIIITICIIIAMIILSILFHGRRKKNKMMNKMIKKLKKATPDEIKTGNSGAGAVRSILLYPYNNSGDKNEEE